MESGLFEERTQESSNNIRLINKSTILKICSGQVVASLAIAVKELVENSIDAGATSIEINLKEFGLASVEVIDNGSGVQENDFNGLAVRYSTSKLKEFSDLRTVSTLGFRGEALSSLCSLSDVEITTRHQSSPFGWCLVYDHDGNIVHKKPCAHPVGTSVVISNLFVTLPVRKKEFSRNIKTEYNKLIELLRAYCLICKNTRIKCNNITNKGRKLVLHTKGNKSCLDNISDVFSSKQVSNLVEITSTLSNGQKYCVDSFQEVEKNLNIALKLEDVEKMNKRIKFEGWISSCAHGCGRNSSDRQYFYINSRPCEPKQIKKFVNGYYRQYNNSQYPFVFLNIEINTYDMDINLTPDKRLILIHNETLIICMLKLSLYNKFRRIASTHKLQNIPLLPEINRTGTEVEVNDIGDNKSGAEISTKMSQFLSQFKAGGKSEACTPCNISKLNSKFFLNTANKRRSIEDIMAENFKNKKIKISAPKAKATVTANLPLSNSSDEEDNQEESGAGGKIDCRNIPSSSIEPKVEYFELPKSQEESLISPYFQKTSEESGAGGKIDCRNIPSSSIEPKVEYFELPKSQEESLISPYFQKTSEESGAGGKIDCRNIPSSSIEPKVEYFELPKSQEESLISPYFQKTSEESGAGGKIDCRNIPSSSIEPKVEYFELPKSQEESLISPYFQKTSEERHYEGKPGCRNIPSCSKPKIEYLELPKSQEETSISPYFQKTTEKQAEIFITPILGAGTVSAKFYSSMNSTSAISQNLVSNIGMPPCGLEQTISITPIPNTAVSTFQDNMYCLNNASLNSSCELGVIISDAENTPINHSNVNFTDASSAKRMLCNKDPILILESDEEDVEKKPEVSYNNDIYTTIEQIKSMCIKQKESCLQKKKNTILKRVKFVSQIQVKENKNAEEELRREISNDMYNKMKIIGQFNLGFIITLLEGDLFIVDQHASDEIYNFEKLQNLTTLQSQKLTMPQNLNLSTIDELVVMDHLNVFEANGFKFQIDNDAPPTKRVKLISKPYSQNWEFGKDDILELIFMLQDSSGDFICRPSRIRSMFASRACRKSIMIGTALDKSVMKTIVTNMGKLDEPWNCPHGRPTMRHLINIEMLQESGYKYQSRRFTTKKKKN